MISRLNINLIELSYLNRTEEDERTLLGTLGEKKYCLFNIFLERVLW